jgi:hypothetical protein
VEYFLSEILEDGNHFGDLGIDGRIILKLRAIGYEIVYWIYLTPDGVQ